MTPDADYRNLAQQVRAQLQQIKQARMAQSVVAGDTASLMAMGQSDRHEKRLRRAERLARRAQTGQLAPDFRADPSRQRIAPDAAQAPAPQEVTQAQMPSEPAFFGPFMPTDMRKDAAPIAAVPPISDRAERPAAPDDVPLGAFFGPVQNPEDMNAVPLDMLDPAPAATRVYRTEEVESPALKVTERLTLSATMRVDPGAAQPLAGVVRDAAAQKDDIESWINPVSYALVHPPQNNANGTDLIALPSARPALVWMLQKCGITCLADLAQADVAALTRRMGLVGQIVDVQAWHRFAVVEVGRGPRTVHG